MLSGMLKIGSCVILNVDLLIAAAPQDHCWSAGLLFLFTDSHLLWV